MKVLVVGSHVIANPKLQSQVDWWRLGRPMRELAKHVDWQIDHSPTYIPGFDKYKDLKEFTPEEMERAFAAICEYDIVYSSYHPDPTAYTMLKVARDRCGTQFIMDCDDDMFSINPDNPFWMKITDEQVYWMQRMIADNDWIVTPSPVLAERFRKWRQYDAETVTVIPNYISDDYAHPPVDNGEDVVIGYCGGSSHYADLHETGVLRAVEKLMHENKHIRFKSVGMVVDKYIPRGRFEFNPGQRGTKFLTDVFPKLGFDIALGPLLPNLFNEGKSNIKWQESTRAGAAFVASRMGPYQTLKNGVTAVLVENTTEAWYGALKELTTNHAYRLGLVRRSQDELERSWRLEDHWQPYQRLFERVYKYKQKRYGEKTNEVTA
jgi:glycosyltransferase involved in cell wall biosynthesis